MAKGSKKKNAAAPEPQPVSKAVDSGKKASASGKPLLSVIVPTYNEAGNMEKLLTGLQTTLTAASVPYEILVMDDNSPDGTSTMCDSVARAHHIPARCIVRTQNRGLSPAVIDGYAAAKGDVLLVMDADLSHPISAVPKLYKAITDGADIAVGSRHCAGGGIEDWPLKRRIISIGAALMARPLTSCTDPMAGFYAIRPEVIEDVKLDAEGFKILLEVLVKGRYNKLVEVPITFRDREVGESKLGSKVIFNYIGQLIQLYLYPGSAPLLKFLFVGGCGAVLDLVIFTLLMHYVFLDNKEMALYAQIASFCCSLAFNYTLNTFWTFPERPEPKKRDGKKKPEEVISKKKSGAAKLVKYIILNAVSFTVRTFLFQYLQQKFQVTEFPYLQLLLLSVILCVTCINFIGSKLWAFK